VAGPWHGWLYAQGPDGVPYEIINQARTAAYLKNPTLTVPAGISICDVLDFGGCESYAYKPPCDTEPAFIELPGVVGNYVSTPDAAVLDVLADITIIVDVAMDDWTPATTQTLLAKWATAGQLSYSFSLTTGGQLQFQWTANGTTINTVTSASGLDTLPAGTRRAVRVDMDSVVGSNREVKFYTAASFDKSYVQLGTTAVGTSTSIFSGTSQLTIGQQTTTTLPLAGRIFYAQVRNGVSGTPTVGGSAVLTVDPGVLTSVTQPTFLATTGQTMTINETGSPGVRVFLGPTGWEPEQYLTPLLDEAPWYDAARPESARAFGFFVEEWTGLDSGHVTRPVSASGPYRSTLGRISAGERVMKLNILMIGADEQAVEYLFRWLESVLVNVCATCETSSVYFRRFCPTGSDKGEGVGELREAGLSESLTWESDPISASGGACRIRRASFTLTAADPCIYVNGTTAAVQTTTADMANCVTGMAISTSRDPCRPSCQELPATCRSIYTWTVNPLGTAAPIVKFVNDNDVYSSPLRAIAYFNPNLVATTGNNTCGLPRLGEIYVAPLPPWSELVWDVAARDVLYYDHTTGGYVSGWAFVDANDPPLQRFFAVPCGQGLVVLEPASACLTFSGGRYSYAGIDLGISPEYPTTTV
jgi:hypothetical protein